MTDQAIAEVRAFNRFYTNLIGVLDEGLVDSPFSVTEARVLYELAHGAPTEVAELRRVLDVDSGYLSRILARFEADGVVMKERSAADRRRQVIRLTGTGQEIIAGLDARSAKQTAGLLAPLPGEDRRRLIDAMRTITEVLTKAPAPRAYQIRAPQPGDMGWVVQRHGAMYAEEFGWDETFEALVARLVADYVSNRDPRKEAAWIAEVDGQRAGCVFCVREGDQDGTTARLRMLLVEPWARGLGIGGRMVDEVLRFARNAGYSRVVLWTHDVQADALRLYKRAGFSLDSQSPSHSFGTDLIDQTWSRALT